MIERAKAKLTEETAGEILKKFDSDGDGKVDKAEF